MVNGTAYFLVPGAGSPPWTVLMKSTAGAAATVVTTYMGENATSAGIVADGKGGLYELVGGDMGGIYSATTSGAQTVLDSSMTAQSPDGIYRALDATHLYYGVVGASVFELWATAR